MSCTCSSDETRDSHVDLWSRSADRTPSWPGHRFATFVTTSTPNLCADATHVEHVQLFQKCKTAGRKGACPKSLESRRAVKGVVSLFKSTRRLSLEYNYWTDSRSCTIAGLIGFVAQADSFACPSPFALPNCPFTRHYHSRETNSAFPVFQLARHRKNPCIWKVEKHTAELARCRHSRASA
jgi:hypothetical protein